MNILTQGLEYSHSPDDEANNSRREPLIQVSPVHHFVVYTLLISMFLRMTDDDLVASEVLTIDGGACHLKFADDSCVGPLF